MCPAYNCGNCVFWQDLAGLVKNHEVEASRRVQELTYRERASHPTRTHGSKHVPRFSKKCTKGPVPTLLLRFRPNDVFLGLMFIHRRYSSLRVGSTHTRSRDTNSLLIEFFEFSYKRIVRSPVETSDFGVFSLCGLEAGGIPGLIKSRNPLLWHHLLLAEFLDQFPRATSVQPLFDFRQFWQFHRCEPVFGKGIDVRRNLIQG